MNNQAYLTSSEEDISSEGENLYMASSSNTQNTTTTNPASSNLHNNITTNTNTTTTNTNTSSSTNTPSDPCTCRAAPTHPLLPIPHDALATAILTELSRIFPSKNPEDCFTICTQNFVVKDAADEEGREVVLVEAFVQGRSGGGGSGSGSGGSGSVVFARGERCNDALVSMRSLRNVVQRIGFGVVGDGMMEGGFDVEKVGGFEGVCSGCGLRRS